MSHSDINEALACRRMWVAAVETHLNDFWKRAAKARREDDPAALDRLYREALAYYRKPWAQHVLLMAGIEASPEQMARCVIDPDAKQRRLSTERKDELTRARRRRAAA